jgi:hypothetical protein
VQPVAVEPPAAGQRVVRGRRHLGERRGRREALLGGEALDLAAELRGELVVVAGEQGASVEGVVGGRKRMDRPANDVGDDDVAVLDRRVVRLARDALGRAPSASSAASRVKSDAGQAAASASVRPSRTASPERASRNARI